MKYIQIDIDAKGFSQAERVGTLGHDMIRGSAVSPSMKWSGFFHSFIRL